MKNNLIKRFFKNLKRYWKTLMTDDDFDFYYLERLIQLKLSFMKKYFQNTPQAVDGNRISKEIDLTLKIKDVFDELEFYSTSQEEGFKYVNIRNYKRFIPYHHQETFKTFFNDENQMRRQLGLEKLRYRKAKYLFYARLHHYSDFWWDL